VRQAWDPTIPLSQRLAYAGSTIDAGAGTSTGGGLSPNAIVKVSVTTALAVSPNYGAAETTAALTIPADQIGVRQSVTITGMIEWQNRNSLNLQLTWGWFGAFWGVNRRGVLDAGPFTVTVGDLPATPAETDLVPFQATATIWHAPDHLWRRHLEGPNARTWGNGTQYVGCDLTLTNGGTTLAPALSPFTMIVLS